LNHNLKRHNKKHDLSIKPVNLKNLKKPIFDIRNILYLCFPPFILPNIAVIRTSSELGLLELFFIVVLMPIRAPFLVVSTIRLHLQFDYSLCLDVAIFMLYLTPTNLLFNFSLTLSALKTLFKGVSISYLFALLPFSVFPNHLSLLRPHCIAPRLPNKECNLVAVLFFMKQFHFE